MLHASERIYACGTPTLALACKLVRLRFVFGYRVINLVATELCGLPQPSQLSVSKHAATIYLIFLFFLGGIGQKLPLFDCAFGLLKTLMFDYFEKKRGLRSEGLSCSRLLSTLLALPEEKFIFFS